MKIYLSFLLLVSGILFSCEKNSHNLVCKEDTIIKPAIDSVPIFIDDSDSSIQEKEETIIYPENCRCDSFPNLNEYISCEPIYFNNKSKLVRNFNCDSSWLTFENAQGNRVQLYSLNKELVGLTHKLGYIGFTEYKTAFLVENRTASGCCQPNDYYLHDKSTGKLIKYLGRAVYVSEEKNLPFLISLTNSNYDNDASGSDYNSLTIYNLDTKKEFKVSVPIGDIKKGMDNNMAMYPEDLIETEVAGRGIVLIKYYTHKYEEDKPVKYKMVKIDLNKYKY